MSKVHARKKLVIAGGSGYLGTTFAQHLLEQPEADWEIVILSRSEPRLAQSSDRISFESWDGRSLGDWTRVLHNCTHVLNLAGRSVDCRKTPARCDEILRSRVESTRVLGEAFAQIDHQPLVWVQMSTAHIYGDPPSVVCDESSPFGYGLAPTVGQAWEAAFAKACPDSTRGVVLRTSFVLGREGGAFPTLRRVARLGLGGRVGSGTQGISWIHEHDMNRIFEDALTNDTRSGVYIATAPEPVSYMQFMRALRKRLGQPIALPGPEIGLRLMCATVLDTDPDLVLYGRYCMPRRLQDEGFKFRYGTLDEVLEALVPK
ncbi:MAG: epimerase [Phycisphaerae bacterium]|nr:epimerase [Phycisphaerae bacterium]MBM90303.1 epimerase [Phycisphaerae bacterium]HCT46461.1 epimerase [Phycisphaerales bacterium]